MKEADHGATARGPVQPMPPRVFRGGRITGSQKTDNVTIEKGSSKAAGRASPTM